MISVVVPVRDEEESLATLHEELAAVFATLGPEPVPVEFIFVDDGSRDGTWGALLALARLDPTRVSAIRFRRNFGKAAALIAAFQQARGELVFTLDGDLQDDPREIPLFLAQLATGYDVVSGWKKTRHDPWHKVYPSRVFNWMVSRLTGCHLHDHNCGFKLYRRQVLREIDIYGELHRFIPVLAYARGFKVGEVEVRHRRRRHGVSKYGFSRFIKGFLDLLTVRFLTRFSQRPIHILGGIGLVLFGAGKPGHALSGHTLARSEEPADRRSPVVAVLDRQPDRGSSTRQPGHPGRAGHVIQLPRRGYLQHRRDDSRPGRKSGSDSKRRRPLGIRVVDIGIVKRDLGFGRARLKVAKVGNSHVNRAEIY